MKRHKPLVFLITIVASGATHSTLPAQSNYIQPWSTVGEFTYSLEA